MNFRSTFSSLTPNTPATTRNPRRLRKARRMNLQVLSNGESQHGLTVACPCYRVGFFLVCWRPGSPGFAGSPGVANPFKTRNLSKCLVAWWEGAGGLASLLRDFASRRISDQLTKFTGNRLDLEKGQGRPVGQATRLFLGSMRHSAWVAC